MADASNFNPRNIIINTFFKHLRRSYSQSGEDIIISDLFIRLGISHPAYLDIGANDPVFCSNTYRLYTRGSKGVCMEPNPILYKKLLSKRNRDTVLNAGIAFDDQTEADYFIFQEAFNGLNTFSRTDATYWEQHGNKEYGKQKVEKVIRMPLININEVMKKYFDPHPNLISIDVEGLDLEILRSIDFLKFKPEVFCVETLAHLENDKESKNMELIRFLESNGYFIYADTYINTIFCRKDIYSKYLH